MENDCQHINIQTILDSDMEFIVPLKSNTKEVHESAKPFSTPEKVKPQHFQYNKCIVCYAEFVSKKHKVCNWGQYVYVSWARLW